MACEHIYHAPTHMHRCCVTCHIYTLLHAPHTTFQQKTWEQKTDRWASDDSSLCGRWEGLGAPAMVCSRPLDTYLVGSCGTCTSALHTSFPNPLYGGRGCPIRQGNRVGSVALRAYLGTPTHISSCLIAPWGAGDEQLLTC